MTKISFPARAAAALLTIGLSLSLTACDEPAPTPATSTVVETVTEAPPEPEPVEPSDTDGPSEPAPATADSTTADAALATLATLAVKGRAPRTGYERELFGQSWSDDVRVDGGRNGCDTRNDILRRDLTATVLKPGTRDCVVMSGTLNDPYTGTSVPFTRGGQTSSEVQIDHVVALADAWQKGAQSLDENTRRDFANDPLNLQATIGSVNQQKGAGDAATWLPPNRSYRCTYVTRQIEVKARYDLWVTSAEKDAMTRILGECGATREIAPQEESTTSEPAPSPARAPEPTPEAEPTPPAGSDVYYPNCTAARAAGAAPLYRGEPGYRPGMDGDGDGIACE